MALVDEATMKKLLKFFSLK